MADLTTPYAQRLCLSGVESRRLLDTFKSFGVPHISVSFYYLKRVFGDPLEFEEYAKNFKTVIIDSGTIYHNHKTEDERNDFISDYASYIAALDKRAYSAVVYEKGSGLDKVVPDEALIYPIDGLREVFDNDLGSLFKNIKYVGVGNKEIAAKGGENCIPLFAYASKSGSYIHAFGTGSKKLLTKYPFYSANSSSWRSGSRYLNTYIYEGPGRGLRLIQPSDKGDPVKTEREMQTIRRRQKNLTEIKQPNIAPLISWDEVQDGDSWEVDKANLAQWMLYQQDLELLAHNKYFLAENEKADITARKAAIYALPANSSAAGTTPNSEGSNKTNRDIEEGNSRREEEEIVDAEVVEDSPIEGANNTPPVYSTGVDIPANTISDISPVPGTANMPNPRITTGDLVAKGRSHEVDPRMSVLRQCDFCSLAGRCPKYSPGNSCAFGYGPESSPPDPDNIQQIIRTQLVDNLTILQDSILQLSLEERMDASGANKDLTARLKLWADMVQQASEAMDTRDTAEIKVKGHGILSSFINKPSA